MSEEKKVKQKYKLFINSWHCRAEGHNAVGVTEDNVTEYEDGTEEHHTKLALYKDPKRPFWVTKPQFRDHDYKREFERMDHCDEYICHDSELEGTLAQALGYSAAYRRRGLRQLCSSPYVYGADMDTETLIKQAYRAHAPAGKMAHITRGGLDIESEVRGDKRINLITYIHENQIYTAALEEYCKIHLGNDKFKPATKEDCLKVINEMLGEEFKKHGFTLTFEICPTELDVIKWTFDRIHECKTDFIGVWNLGFDLPKILERTEALGGDPVMIMCHPDVPVQYRFVDWHEDKSMVQHYTDKWHRCTIAGYSQFVDSMCLYARLRKVQGREASYSLDAISNKELGQGKIHFGEITNHWYEQHYNFLPYIAYNINDVLIMILMERKVNDIISMSALASKSLISQFSRQTVMLKNNAYEYAKSRGMVPSSAGPGSETAEYDNLMLKAGGTVLPPNKARGVGINAVEEIDRPTLVSVFTNDLDVSSMYPSIIRAFNISKESCLGTIIGINGHRPEEIEPLCSAMLQPEVSALQIAEEFYNLPGYTTMKKKFEEYLAGKKKK